MQLWTVNSFVLYLCSLMHFTVYEVDSYRGSRSVHSEFATFKCTALYCTDPKLPRLYFIGKCGVGTVLTQKMVLVLNLDSDDLHRSWFLT